MALRGAYTRGRELYTLEMARLLEELRQRAPVPVREALQESQRQWETFREAEEGLDDATFARRRGSLAGVLILERRLGLIRDRVVRLRRVRESVLGE